MCNFSCPVFFGVSDVFFNLYIINMNNNKFVQFDTPAIVATTHVLLCQSKGQIQKVIRLRDAVSWLTPSKNKISSPGERT